MGLSHNPQSVSKKTWYYEEPRGILVVHEARDEKTGAWIQTDQFKIPWWRLRKSLKRKDSE